MTVVWRMIGFATGLGSTVAWLYVLATGQWRVVLVSFVFSIASVVITFLVNVPLGVFWREMNFPDGLTAPGLQLLVNPWRVFVVSRLPHLAYGALAYGIGFVAFLLFGESARAIDRAALMLIGYAAAFTAPTTLAKMLIVQDDTRGVFLSALTLHAKLAFLILLVVHTVTPLSPSRGALVLAAAMIAIHVSFEVTSARKPLAELIAPG